MKFYEFEKAFRGELDRLFSISKDLYASVNNEDEPLDFLVDNSDAIKTLTSFNSYLMSIYSILYDVHILFNAPESVCDSFEKDIKYTPSITYLFSSINDNLRCIESEVDYIFECIFGDINTVANEEALRDNFDDISSYFVDYLRAVTDKLSCCLEYFKDTTEIQK